MLRGWKAELNEPSPTSSLQKGGNLGSFSTDICRPLQLCEEEDDATSPLATPKSEPKLPRSSLKLSNASVHPQRLRLRALMLGGAWKSNMLLILH